MAAPAHLPSHLHQPVSRSFSGPGGILGAAEGLAFLAVLAGVVVLGLQIKDYGYIPNAVPTEGGKCS